MTQNVVFLNRTYNDMDIQASLVAAFAQDPAYRVRVIGYPCDGQFGTPERHEGASYLRTLGVTIESLARSHGAPILLRGLAALEAVAYRVKNATKSLRLINFFARALHVLCLRATKFYLTRTSPDWIQTEAQNWDAKIIILDEVSAQPNRSVIVDRVLPALVAKGAAVYTIQTGQNVYNDPFPSGARPVYKPSVSRLTFLASALDKEIYAIQFPQEKTEVAGNLRLNRNWIKTLHTHALAPPCYDPSPVLRTLPAGKTRVVFMLSKMTYGISDPEALINAIRAVAALPNVAVAVKPHTRGMKLNFMNVNDYPNMVDATFVPSSLLAQWCDVLLFTGSSIGFHGIFLKKAVGLLRYCQKHETIFDTAPNVTTLATQEHLLQLVQNPACAYDQEIADAWLRNAVEGGFTDDIAQHHKRRIEETLR